MLDKWALRIELLLVKSAATTGACYIANGHIITPHWWNGTHTWIALTRFLLHVSRYISREKNQLHAYRRKIFELIENNIIFFFFKRKRSLSTILQFLFREFREKDREKFRDFENSKLFIDIERFPTVFSINACKVFFYLSYFLFFSFRFINKYFLSIYLVFTFERKLRDKSFLLLSLQSSKILFYH